VARPRARSPRSRKSSAPTCAGRGGAGFTTGIKWEACRHATGLTRYVVCNADEGEPGTFKDRRIAREPRRPRVRRHDGGGLRGRREPGFLYLRGEYRYLLEPLEATLERRRAAKPARNGICGQAGFDFDIRIHVGAGSYVCGEESASDRVAEGKRGCRATARPIPVTNGYKQQPTIVNTSRRCAPRRSSPWPRRRLYRAQGTLKSAGTK